MLPLSRFRRRVRGDCSHGIGFLSGSLLCKSPISGACMKNEPVVFDKPDNDRVKYSVKKLNERREDFDAASKKIIRRFIVPTQREHDEKTAETLISQIISKKKQILSMLQQAKRSVSRTGRPRSRSLCSGTGSGGLAACQKRINGRFIPERPGKARVCARTLPDFSPPACHRARSSLP